jgi:hypothetical protein
MKDREMIQDRFGVERLPLGENYQNTVIYNHNECDGKYNGRDMMSPEQKLKSFGMVIISNRIDHYEQIESQHHVKKNSQNSGFKNCNSMKDIVQELSKIVENSNKKENSDRSKVSNLSK